MKNKTTLRKNSLLDGQENLLLDTDKSFLVLNQESLGHYFICYLVKDQLFLCCLSLTRTYFLQPEKSNTERNYFFASTVQYLIERKSMTGLTVTC
jgi:hypothetical protein